MRSAQARRAIVTKAAIAVGGLSVLLAGCAIPARSFTPTGGERVVVVVSGTANEPKPFATPAAEKILRDAANSTDVSAQGSGKSSVALISAADGSETPAIVLTPRRADGALEHGLNRPTLIDDNVRKAADVIGATAAHRAGLDLLGGIDLAVRGIDPGTLVVDSSGLATAGAFDLRQVGWNADPATISRQLAAAGQLPDLTGWHVLFTGLGAVAGAQPPLPTPARDKLAAYWKALCQAAHAASCDLDQTRVPAHRPESTVATPVVPVPGVQSVVGPSGRVSTTVSDSALGFAGDSAGLSPAARDLLRSLAESITARLADRPQATVTVRGYAADPPGSTPAGRQELAALRARVVAGALTASGVTNHLDVAGIGTEPGATAIVGGRFDEPTAARLRRVEITY
ncbi:OmpA family protein [Amycolatopsis rhabdoformis]|uniref:OmpA family protein n=1 Tax=Amycolatopsis rhabdoformis TaxID=1448059 RepID=A0ABZ1I5W9_9PSEU|nr:OmpA family protein [Amycolatopsis rhabdoformis]WSE29757.1 OmpA family protein [Amycolatopsis rhabdoformis]